MTCQVLKDAGLIAGGDMTPEAALSKLSYVLAKMELDLDAKKKVGVFRHKSLTINTSLFSVELKQNAVFRVAEYLQRKKKHVRKGVFLCDSF